MIRQFLTLILSLIISNAVAQKVIFEKDVKLQRGFWNDREAYPVQGTNDSVRSLFLIDRNSITGLLFNKDLVLVDTIESVKSGGSFPNLLGSNISQGKYNLFFESNSHAHLAVISFDYAGHKTTQSLIDLPLEKEKFAGAASYNNKFYILTVRKKTSMLNVYEFSEAGKFELHTFDFKEEHFKVPPAYTLFEAIKEHPFEVVDNEIPNSIEVVAKRNKLYCYDNKMMLTFDNLYSNTKVISIDLSTFDVRLRGYKKTEPECCKEVEVSTNSYLYKNNLYQLFVCSKGMNFTISSLKDKTVINSFEGYKGDEIDWRNTPIHQEGGSWDKDRDLSKTKQFLRKASAGNAGICAYQSSHGIEVTLGGYQETQGGSMGGGGMMTPGSTIPTPYGVVTTAPTYYPTYAGYNSYKFTKSVYFKSLLNGTSFEHVDGEVSDNAFDKIQKFSKDKEEDITAETVIKRNGLLIFGYYDKTNHVYRLLEFAD